MKYKFVPLIMLISISILFTLLITPAQAQFTVPCDSCGMSVDATGQARFRIVDGSGSQHVACCPICAFKLIKTYGQLNITSFCDYNGPNYPITIMAKQNGSILTVNPQSALIILGGGCTKNRMVYDAEAANSLLSSPNNGTSKWLSPMTNATVFANATRMGIAQAILQYVSVSPSSQPSNTPEATSTPASSPTPTMVVSQQCEACGMDVTAESQARYKVTDGDGNVHYVECFMCALNLVNDYQTLHIVTFCDWYGPNFPIKVDSSNYGQTITVNSNMAIFLRGGSCVTARAAYNQTAADNLLAMGFSQYTSPEQQYALPASTDVKLVSEAIRTWYAQPNATGSPTSLMLVLIAAIGVIFIAGSIVAYKKLNKRV
jgi:hypothetical protein